MKREGWGGLQERIRIPDDKMEYYKDLAEMYVGDDVSPDFYGWVFPKYDHVAVGTGTVVNKPGIKQYQQVILSPCSSAVCMHMRTPPTTQGTFTACVRVAVAFVANFHLGASKVSVAA